MPYFALALLSLSSVQLACVQSADVPVTGDGGAGDEDDTPCNTQVIETWPASGALDVWLQPELSVSLDPPDASADLSLVDGDGQAAAATPAVVDSGAAWRLDLSEPLDADTSYTLQINHCNGSRSISFTTVNDPGAPEDLSTPTVYQLDPTHGRVVHPEYLNTALGPLWPDQPWLLSVHDDGGDLQLRIGGGQGSVQDFCLPTIDIDGASLVDDLHFSLGPTTLPLELDAGTMTLYDASLSATFAYDGGELAGIQLEALVDARDIAELGLMGDTADEVCAELARYGTPCDDCGDGNAWCLDTRWDSWTASRVDAVSELEQIDHVDCHPQCEDSWTNPTCNTAGW